MNVWMHRLKRETWPLHERLEQRLNLLGPHITEAGYRRLILDFWGNYHPLESPLANLPGLHASIPDLDWRFKKPLLETDLRHLGHSPDTIARMSVCEDLPLLQCLPSALGYLYVLEGATLGGQVISRHLRLSLGLDAHNGAAFLWGYGEQTGAMWRSFGERLASAGAAMGPGEARMVEAARATFESLERWLFRRGSHG